MHYDLTDSLCGSSSATNGGAIGTGYTVCMHEKGPQEPPEHTSEHVKYQTFLGVCPQTLLTHPFCGAPVFIFALPPSQSSQWPWVAGLKGGMGEVVGFRHRVAAVIGP